MHKKWTRGYGHNTKYSLKVYNVVFWLNSFPHKDGVHATISPRTLITGLAIDYHKHCKIGFGTYVQVHKEGAIHSDKGHQGR